MSIATAVEALLEEVNNGEGWALDTQVAEHNVDEWKIIFEGRGSIPAVVIAYALTPHIPVSEQTIVDRIMYDQSWMGRVHLNDRVEFSVSSVSFTGGAFVDVKLLVEIAAGP